MKTTLVANQQSVQDKIANEAATKWRRKLKTFTNNNKYTKCKPLYQKFTSKTKTEDARHACLPFRSIYVNIVLCRYVYGKSGCSYLNVCSAL